MNVYYLQHSGFVLDDGVRCYIFDYYKDPAGHVERFYNEGRELWFFVSHSHGDHYNPAILDFKRPSTKYIMHADVPMKEKGDQMIRLSVGQEIAVDEVTITMYGSTDEGGSFLVNTPFQSFFHAGDLNWWHWLGDTPENNRQAREWATEELGRLRGLSVDIAFFPVDERLEEAREWGVWEFLALVEVKKMLVPMHSARPWKPSIYFQSRFGNIPLWIPKQNGEAVAVE